MRFISVNEALNLIPHPLIIITVGDDVNRAGMTAAWFSRVSWDPPLVAVSIAPTRYTFELIRRFKEFAIHVVSKDLVDKAVNVFGTLSSKDVDKFKLSKLTIVPARKIKAPIMKEAPVVLECKVINMVKAGDHIIVIGQVVESYINAEKEAVSWYKGTACELVKID